MPNIARRMKKGFAPASFEKRLAEKVRSLRYKIASKFVELENFIDPPVDNGPGPIYTVGSPDPRAFTKRQTMPSGIDTKVYITDVDSDLKEAVELTDKASLMVHRPVGDIQGVDFGFYGSGTITFLIFDGMEEIERFLGKKKRLVLHWSNEYGKEAILADKVIQFANEYVWSVNVDDLVIEAYLEFEVERDLRRCEESE